MHWLLFSLLALGVVGAVLYFRHARRQQRGGARIPPLMHVPVPWVFVIAFLAGIALQYWIPLKITSPPVQRGIFIAGIVLTLCGVSLAFSGLGLFRAKNTTTIPFGSPSTLVTSGPYRFTRNPMYVGLSLTYLGVAGTNAQIWPILLLPL
ncbi:MAG TPA: methyltransferase, partial [Tepidisphaeraceae bacterium]